MAGEGPRDLLLLVTTDPAASTVRCSTEEVSVGRLADSDVVLRHTGVSRRQCTISTATGRIRNVGIAEVHVLDEYGVAKHTLRQGEHVAAPSSRFSLSFYAKGLSDVVERVDARLVSKGTPPRLYDKEPHPFTDPGRFVDTLKRKHGALFKAEVVAHRRAKTENAALKEENETLRGALLSLQASVARLQTEKDLLNRSGAAHPRRRRHPDRPSRRRLDRALSGI